MHPSTPLALLVAALAATATAPAAARAETAGYTNTTPIVIPEVGKASPYPSPIEVQGRTGRITDVSLSLNGFRHGYPNDVDVLLEAPGVYRKGAVVMSDVCGNVPLQSIGWIFTETAAEMSGYCPGLFYHPTNGMQDDDIWPTVREFYDDDFDAFIGEVPNGVWRLYVVDDTNRPDPDAGEIKNGWSLNITTEPAEMVIPANSLPDGKASPYPAVRPVAGLDGVVADVDVRLRGIHHERAVDLDALLVGPGGQAVTLLDYACGYDPVRGATWRFDDEAPTAASECAVDGAFRPTDQSEEDSLPEPAPAGPYSPALAAFDGTDPNGEWRLYVRDNLPTDVSGRRAADGFLAAPFELEITTRPRAGVALGADTWTVREGETRELVVTRAGAGLGAGSVRVSTAPGSAASGSDFAPVSDVLQFAPGERSQRVPVAVRADDQQEGEETFAVRLSDPSGDAAVAAPAAATVTIPADPAAAVDPADPADPVRPADPGVPARPADPVGGPAASDAVPPAISRLSRRRATVRYTLSEPARVELRLERRVCPRTRRCRSVTVSTLRRDGRPGRNRVALGRRVLRRGAYRLVLRATDAAGNRSTARLSWRRSPRSGPRR